MNENLKIIKLKNRTLLELKGDESKEFLQSLVTNNINLISKEKSIYSALLSPQGKYLYDFFIFMNINNNIMIENNCNASWIYYKTCLAIYNNIQLKVRIFYNIYLDNILFD